MIQVSILVLHEAIIGSIDAPKQIFSKVNDFLVEDGKAPIFEISLVGTKKTTTANHTSYQIIADHTIHDEIHSDLIVIPMICNGMANSVRLNKAFVPWLKDQYADKAEIACLCVGSFVLASTGLLDGKSCAVHWGATDDFRALFPAVKIVDDKLITYEDGIYTCGGYYSYLNLILCLVEKYAGRQMAVFVSKMFEIEIERKSQGPFMILKGQKSHPDTQILKVQEFIENNYADKISIDQLTARFAVSRRNFERRFKKATANTVVEYLQRVRIEAVKKSLETTKKTVTDVMYQVGYVDIKSFRTTFKKYTGLSPVQYRNKYSQKYFQ